MMIVEDAMSDVIAKVVAEQRGAGEKVQASASDDQISAERTVLRDRFKAELPADYARLLSVVNGVDFNGVVLYGAGYTQASPGAGGFWQGIAEANALWREAPGHEAYLVLGESDMDLLTVDLDGRRPVLRDKVSSDVFKEFTTVNEAVERLLRSRLQ
jgi:hypothetical protein